MVCLTPVAFYIAVWPIFGHLASHMNIALQTSRADPWSRRWWDWPGSWVLVAGPFGRWIIGTILGFQVLRSGRNESDSYPGHFIEKPHMRIVTVVGLGLLLSLFAVVSGLISNLLFHDTCIPR